MWVSVAWSWIVNNPIARWIGAVVAVLIGLKFAEAMVRRDERKRTEERWKRQERQAQTEQLERLHEQRKSTREAVERSPHSPTSDSVPDRTAGVLFRD